MKLEIFQITLYCEFVEIYKIIKNKFWAFDTDYGDIYNKKSVLLKLSL